MCNCEYGRFVRDDIQPPNGFMAAKAWDVLSSYYRQKANKLDQT